MSVWLSYSVTVHRFPLALLPSLSMASSTRSRSKAANHDGGDDNDDENYVTISTKDISYDLEHALATGPPRPTRSQSPLREGERWWVTRKGQRVLDVNGFVFKVDMQGRVLEYSKNVETGRRTQTGGVAPSKSMNMAQEDKVSSSLQLRWENFSDGSPSSPHGF
jgi:hypothetical protein